MYKQIYIYVQIERRKKRSFNSFLGLVFFFELGHHFLPGAFRTNDIAQVLDETLAHHRVLANGAEEAAVVPSQLLEGHELGAAQASFTYIFRG